MTQVELPRSSHTNGRWELLLWVSDNGREHEMCWIYVIGRPFKVRKVHNICHKKWFITNECNEKVTGHKYFNQFYLDRATYLYGIWG